jgi:IS30 family transposase
LPLATRHEREHQRAPPPILPKGSDLRAYTLADLQAVEQRINDRPRQRLAWRSPARVMETELAG